ncbi:Hint domain-containing protein [Actinomadura sp. 9N407]|uniref:Hint domain-containing protein n=1 Tax=Actinomadura sp. 9N407 TaxID=3375154 RepID=UPI0037B21D12
MREAREALAAAEQEAQDVEGEWDEFDLLAEIGKIGLDFLAGDIIACVEEPNLVDCLWALVGLVPWGKIGKLLKSIPKVIKLIDRFLDLKRRLDKARKARKDAKDRLDDALEACKNRKGGNSFVPGTPVLMADGSRRPIEAVGVGDLVWASDPRTGRAGPFPVTALIAGQGVKHLVELTIDLDGWIGGPIARITATTNHPFWLPSGGWTDAGDLMPGDVPATPDGRSVLVVDTLEYTRTGRVHNLTVDGPHTYYTTAGGVDLLVHNDPTPIPGEACGVGSGPGTPEPGTPEYQQRIDELSQDPSHVGKVTPQQIREAEVGLELERRGDLPGPIKRAPKINGKDTGEFVDANGQHWDIKGFTDIYQGGPKKGQPMPPNARGRYDRQEAISAINHELAQNPVEKVILDPKNLSPQALQDLRDLVASKPEWQGKVIFF